MAGNVVPDRATVVVNHRFAPDRVRRRSRGVAVVATSRRCWRRATASRWWTSADGAPPGLDHPLLAALVARNRLEVRAKLGWTDVARFAAHGIPAANFGPGDPLLAHTADERVARDAIERSFAALQDLLVNGPS